MKPFALYLLNGHWYWILLCLLAGAAYSALLYWLPFGRRDSASQKGKGVTVALSVVRFITVSLIALLLTQPIVRRQMASRDRPIVVVAHDASQSVLDAGGLPDARLWRLERDYEVVYDTFGGKSTNIAAALGSIADRYAGRNLGAVVLATDGLYNQGQDPTEAAQKLAVPIYTLALGDTTRRPDAAVADVRYNRVAHLGTQFPIEATLTATLLQGQQATLSVTHNGRTLFKKNVSYATDAYASTETISLPADQPGLQLYTLALSACTGESTTANNSRTLAIEVLDGHRRIALLAAAPHPDVSALRQVIERNPNYRVDLYTGQQVTQPTAADRRRMEEADYGLFILHNLPSPSVPLPTAQQSRWGKWDLRQVPTLSIVGTQTDLTRFNSLRHGVEIIAKSQHTDEATATVNNAFGLFSLDEGVADRLAQWPPLVSPFGQYRTSEGLYTLAYATLGGQPTDRPLIALGQQGTVRRAFVLGEGVWRWRLHNYLQTGSHTDFDQLLEKVVVYTSSTATAERLHVEAQRIYREDEPVQLRAEVYDADYELTTRCEVNVVVSSPATKASTYTMNPSGTSFVLGLGSLPPGQYTYTASTILEGKTHTATGTFAVEEFDLERLNRVANHSMLTTLSATTGGTMLLPQQAGELPKLLAGRDDLKSVIYQRTQHRPLLEMPWVLVLLVLLLTVEWAGRKYFIQP